MKTNNESIKRDIFKLDLIKDAELIGPYGMPLLKGIQIDEEVKMLPFNYIFSTKQPNLFYLHFYLDDYQFERIWNYPYYYAKILPYFKGVVAPDFSLYIGLPKIWQIWNCYRSRVLAYFWQSLGISVIPNATWSDEESFNWCFDGLPTNSAIAVSSLGCMNNSESILNFCKGFKEMDKRLHPTKIFFYGNVPESLKDDNRIVHIETFTQLKFNFEEENV